MSDSTTAGLCFYCPTCNTLLHVARERGGLRVSCPKCGQHIVSPRAVPAPAPRARAYATLKADANDVELARWRYWAAQVRDRRAPHHGARTEDAERAGLLARLLDCWEEWKRRQARVGCAENLLTGLEASVAAITAGLLAHGVLPPEPAGKAVVGSAWER